MLTPWWGACSKHGCVHEDMGVLVRAACTCLSPVNTHTLMPPCIMLAMASGTPSCSLSSMAVQPT